MYVQTCVHGSAFASIDDIFRLHGRLAYLMGPAALQLVHAGSDITAGGTADKGRAPLQA